MTKKISVLNPFSSGEYVVYPAHGVGKVADITKQNIAGSELELIVVNFAKDKMTLRIPMAKAETTGLRKISGADTINEALSTLKGKAKVKKVMWSRRAQEYENKINSGSPIAIAEVVRDLHRNENLAEQSYSERQIYEHALDRLANEYAVFENISPSEATQKLLDLLSKHSRGKFGVRRGRRHQGVDIPLKVGEPVYATFTGKVRMSKYMGAFGNLVVIRHDNGIETFYAHLSKRNVEAGDWVNAGDVIGLGGSTGRSTGPHLHFETRYNGFAFDPQWLIDFEKGILRHRLFVLKKKYFNIYSNYEQDFEDEIKNAEDDKKEDAEREAMRWYTIKSGDTLGRIAINHGTTVSELCRLNGISRTTTLKIGRKIRVR